MANSRDQVGATQRQTEEKVGELCEEVQDRKDLVLDARYMIFVKKAESNHEMKKRNDDDKLNGVKDKYINFFFTVNV